MKLSDKIVALRKGAGLSQEGLAERLNVSRQAISRWEQGTAMPDASNLLQLSKLFGVTTDYLLHDDYESDRDLPTVRAAERKGTRQALFYFVILEVMAVLIQVMTFVILQNVFFGLLSLIPFLALLGGFEWAWRKRPEGQSEELAEFRARFYKITAWLGTYFPVRFVVTILLRLWLGPYTGPYTVLLREIMALVAYITVATLLNLSIDKGELRRRGRDE